MGLRAVRSMAYSISASMEFNVPSTICSTIGSTADSAARGSRDCASTESGHELDLLLAGIVVPERAHVCGVECRDQISEESLIDGPARRSDSDLHRLSGIADVGFAHNPDACQIDAVAFERINRVCLERRIER